TDGGYLGARRRGFAPSLMMNLPMLSRQTIPVTIELTSPGAEIEGTVVSPDGRPVPDADVAIANDSDRAFGNLPDGRPGLIPPSSRVKTDASGSFRSPPLAPGTWTVIVSARDWAAARDSFDVAASEPTRVRVALSSGATISGAVRDGDGRAAEGVEVSA